MSRLKAHMVLPITTPHRRKRSHHADPFGRLFTQQRHLSWIALLISCALNAVLLLWLCSLLLVNPWGTTPQSDNENGLNHHHDLVDSNDPRLLNRQDFTFIGGHPPHEMMSSCFCRRDDNNSKDNDNDYNDNHHHHCPAVGCTPSLAIDVVIQSGPDHIWLVQRKDTNQLATMGGFVQVGETVPRAVQRELFEETGLRLPLENHDNENNNNNNTPTLSFLGLYDDPRRDNRRHTVSAVYVVHFGQGAEQPQAADDVKAMKRIPMSDIVKYDYFADHKTILMDYYINNNDNNKRRRQDERLANDDLGDFANDIHRSICSRGGGEGG